MEPTQLLPEPPAAVTSEALDHYLVGEVSRIIDVYSVWAHSVEEAVKMVSARHPDTKQRRSEDPVMTGIVVKGFSLGEDFSGFSFNAAITAQMARTQPGQVQVPTLVTPKDLQ